MVTTPPAPSAPPPAPRRTSRLPAVPAGVVRTLALATLIGNVLIVGTGGAVRLTGSGLGCPTWPQCTEDSFSPTPELAAHGAIEWANRLLGGALGATALITLIAVLLFRPRPRGLVLPAIGVVLAVPAQAVIGGITVLTELNPWVVMLHFLVSMPIIAAATVLWRRSRVAAGAPAPTGPEPAWLPRLVTAVLVVIGAVLVLGAITTGSGPHAGDPETPRTGLDPALMSQVHAVAVWVLLGLSLLLAYLLWRSGGPAPVRRATYLLIGIELLQGVIGYTQYFTGLPELLVGAHMIGAALMVVAGTNLALSRPPGHGRTSDGEAASGTRTVGVPEPSAGTDQTS